MKSTIYALNAELSESKIVLAYNHTLVSVGDQLSKINIINTWPSSLAVDRLYSMAQAVIPKAWPEAISLGGGLIIGGLLASLGIISTGRQQSNPLNIVSNTLKLNFHIYFDKSDIYWKNYSLTTVRSWISILKRPCLLPILYRKIISL